MYSGTVYYSNTEQISVRREEPVHFAKLAIGFAWPNETGSFSSTCENAGKSYLEKQAHFLSCYVAVCNLYSST